MKRTTVVLALVLLAGCQKHAAGPETQAQGRATDSPEDVVRNYFAAATWQDRLPFVLEPDKVRSLIQGRYEKTGPLPSTTVRSLATEKLSRPGDWYAVTAAVSQGRANASMVFYLTKSGGAYKIDWPASVGYNPVPLATYMVQRPEAPQRYRLKATLATYYNYNYSRSQPTHYSVELEQERTATRDAKTVHGYVRKDSADGKRLFQLLSDAKPHPVLVEIRCVGPDDEPTEDSSTVAITRLVSASWLDAE